MSAPLELSNSNCLVTGGAGFIGSHLVERLLKEGAKVTVLDDFSSGKEENLSHLSGQSGLDVVRGSVTDASALEKACAGKAYIFHLAAIPAVVRSVENPAATDEVNVHGTVLMLEAARRLKSLKRVVFTSSSAVYGDTPTLPKSEEMAGRTLSPYALQKWTGENYVRLFHSLYGLPGVSVRPFNVFGPRQSPDNQYAAVIPKFVAEGLSGGELVIHGDGGQTRDFTYIDNMVQMYILAATTQNPEALGQAFNAGAGGQASVNDLAKKVIELTGGKAKIRYTDPRPGDIRDSFADLRKAKVLLSYEPVVSFEEGLKRLVSATVKS